MIISNWNHRLFGCFGPIRWHNHHCGELKLQIFAVAHWWRFWFRLLLLLLLRCFWWNRITNVFAMNKRMPTNWGNSLHWMHRHEAKLIRLQHKLMTSNSWKIKSSVVMITHNCTMNATFLCPQETHFRRHTQLFWQFHVIGIGRAPFMPCVVTKKIVFSILKQHQCDIFFFGLRIDCVVAVNSINHHFNTLQSIIYVECGHSRSRNWMWFCKWNEQKRSTND